MNFIADDLYAQIEASIPIVCVDFVLARRDEDGRVSHVGLIERESPYGRVWCHLGGRVRRGETIRDALQRHFLGSVSGASLILGQDPQPLHVYQWFPEDLAPSANFEFGTDSRKHAVGLSYVIDVEGSPDVVVGGEALALEFFEPDHLPATLWPGGAALLTKLVADY